MINHVKSFINLISQYHIKTIEKVEHGFYLYGKLVARYPWYVIIFSVALAILTSIPLMIGSNSDLAEFDGDQFIDASSDFAKNSKWVDERNGNKEIHTLPGTRVLIVANTDDGNLLTGKNFGFVLQVYNFVKNFTSTKGITFKDQCLQVARGENNDETLRKSSSQLQMMKDLFPYPSICEVFSYFESQMSVSCMEYTPLQLLTSQTNLNSRTNTLEYDFKNESLLLEHLNDHGRTLRDSGKNGVGNHSSLGSIGGISRDNEGHIIAAKTMMSVYFLKGEEQINNTQKSDRKHFQDELKAALVTTFQSDFEKEALEIIVINGAKTENGDPMKHDQLLLAFGGLLVALHLMISFSKFNTMEQRFGLGVCGLISIGLSIVSMNGLGKLFGLPFNAIQTLVMVIMVGIGADDMFVVVQSVKSSNPREQEESHATERNNKTKTLKREDFFEWIGVSIRHAGGSIFMTSLTDCLAFGIGGLSVIPLLKNTCLFASIGVFMLFFYMTTFFVGVLTLDQMRVEDKRDGCLCCFKKSEEWKPTKICTTNSWQSYLISSYIDIILKTPMKVFVVIIALANLGVSIYGATQLQANFDPNMYNANHEVAKMKSYIEKYSPSFLGINANIYLSNITNIPAKLNDIEEMLGNISTALSRNNRQSENSNLEKVVIDSFIPTFQDFFIDKKNLTRIRSEKKNNKLDDEDEFFSLVTEFLFTPGVGMRREWSKSFMFSGNDSLTCGESSPPIEALSFKIQNLQPYPVSGMISRLKEAQDIIDSYDLGGKAFIHANRYPILFVLDVLKTEVFRNVILAMVAVFVCTELVLCNLIGCLIVSINIFIGLVSVCGYLYLLGMDLEITTAMFITIAQGITVDYSAHIVHCFMKTPGSSKEERIKKSMVDIGPAVFNGGVSTFAGFFLCAFGRIPITFVIFKIFSLIVVSGMFGAFVIIPVVLCLFGPENKLPCKDNQVEQLEAVQGNQNHGFVNGENENKPGETGDGTESKNETDVQVLNQNENTLDQDSDEPNKDSDSPKQMSMSSNKMRRRCLKNKLSSSADGIHDQSCEMETHPPNFVPTQLQNH